MGVILVISKIAFKNFRQHLAGRVLYLVAIALLVMISYDCLTTFENPIILKMNRLNPILGLLLILLVALLVFSLLIIFYANRFFVYQRHSEFGLLIVSGLSRGQIAWLFFLETLLGEVLALLAGLVLGMLTNKLFAMLLLRFMGISQETNHWWSLIGLRDVSVAYLVIFMIVGVLDAIRIFQLRPVRLLNPEQSTDQPMTAPWLARLLAWLGPLLVVGSYLAIFKLNWLEPFRLADRASLNTLLIFMALMLGVWFVFRNTLPQLCAHLRQSEWAYRHQRILDLAMTGSEFRRHHQSLTLTTVFVTASVVLLGIAAVSYADNYRDLDEEAPVDLAVDQAYHDQVAQEIRGQGGQLERLTSIQVKAVPAQMRGPHSREIMGQRNMPVEVIPSSAYRRVQRHQRGLPPLILQERQALYISYNFQYQKLPARVLRQNKIKFAQPGLPQLAISGYSRQYPFGNSLFYADLLVVPDAFFEQLHSDPPRRLTGYRIKKMAPDSAFLRKIDHASFASKNLRKMTYHADPDLRKSWLKTSVTGQKKSGDLITYSSNSYSVRGPFQVMLRRVLGVVIFVISLLALLMTFAWASVFSLRQLSQVEQNRFDYLTMKKLGVAEDELLRYSDRQNRRIFLTPVLFGIANGLFIMHFVGWHLDHLPLKLLYLLTLVVFLVYWFFYLFTAYNYRRLLRTTQISTQRLI